MKKNLLTVVIAVILVLSISVFALVGCGDNNTTPSDNGKTNTDDNTPVTPTIDITDTRLAADVQKAASGEEFDTEAYYAESRKLYDEALGEFEETLIKAKALVGDERYAQMAIAEAKFLESAVYIPTSARGGTYAIGRVAPNSICTVLYGNDSYRFHNAVVTTTPITAEDRAALKAIYGANKGTGTYEAKAIAYLKEHNYSVKDTYTIPYTTDPTTWDIFNTQRAVDSEAIVNTYDGLMEYNGEGILQPALATNYIISDDGLTYTFTLRQGVQWVTSQGQAIAEVKADDFVAGFQHLLDQKAEIAGLVKGIVKNATEYIAGDVTDFAQVGVKAVDDYTVEYTLCQPTAYFITMLGYNPFAPMCRSFFLSKGGKFGAEFADAYASESYKYGKSSDDIAYCGPYLVTSNTEKNSIVFSANNTYWNKDNIQIKTLKWMYNDGKDTTKNYKDMVKGDIDSASLNAESLVLAQADKDIDGENNNFEKYGYTTNIDATSFGIFFNINRAGYYNYTNEKVKSSLTVGQANLAKAAMNNVHFRRAIAFAIDRATYNEQTAGASLKLVSLINSYTPGTFVALNNELTVKINGKDKTFKAGTTYGEMIQAQLDADGVKIKAWDSNADSGAGSSAGFDGWYNVENAKEELELALADLEKLGITVTKNNPIIMDLPTFTGNKVYTQRGQVIKQSIEAAFEGKVIINLTECAEADDWYDAGYMTDTGYQANYHIYDCSGWGPDYGDPDTYLNTMVSESGDMIKCLGIY